MGTRSTADECLYGSELSGRWGRTGQVRILEEGYELVRIRRMTEGRAGDFVFHYSNKVMSPPSRLLPGKQFDDEVR